VWHDFWTEERVEGGREVERPVDLATMPLWVRAGAVIPLGPVKQYTEEPNDAPVTLVVYPGADGKSTWYDDDGISFDYRNGEMMRVEMTWQDAARRLTLRLARGSRMLGANPRRFEVRVSGATATRTIEFSGRQVDMVL
jgi:alpha-glucosidase (family GH31 glycosyl hydrolase)